MNHTVSNDSLIFEKIKSVFPNAEFYESQDHLTTDNMVIIDTRSHICWMPQDESLDSDIYESGSCFTYNREIEDGIISSIHSSLDEAIAKAEGKQTGRK